MVLIKGEQGPPVFYIDRSPVTYHNYVAFLNAGADQVHVEAGLVVHVENGLIKSEADIWAYLGDGAAPYEQIKYQDDRFMLRDASWASRPVVRITFLGAQAYARYYHKQLPSLAQWRAGLAVLDGGKAQGASEAESSMANHHASMMEGKANGGAAGTAELQEGESRLREWVVRIESTKTAAADQTDTVSSWVAGGPLSTADHHEKRYPWEAFADVVFRTVIVPAS
jgi:eukaryotic-like serine/threonine-protein kinase